MFEPDALTTQNTNEPYENVGDGSVIRHLALVLTAFDILVAIVYVSPP